MYYQQGDVIIEPCKFPSDGKEVNPENRGFILARGEATGHAHALENVEGVEVVEKDGGFYIRLGNPATLRHEEHRPITIPMGEYRIRKVREYDHFSEEARAVKD